MNAWWIGLLVGGGTGVLSGMGVGGGSLLLLWLTAVAGVEPYAAGVLNLAYFLCCAPPALWQHQKNRLVCWRAVGWGLIGVPLCIGAAVWASSLPADGLRRAFGVLLLAVGWKELCRKK